MMNVLRPKLYTSFDEAAQDPKRVRRLQLYYKAGDGCAEQLAQFINLEELHLGWYFYEEMPSEIQTLPRLQSLTCLNIPLKTLPDWLWSCRNLRHLAVRGSDVRVVSDGIQQLSELRWLELGNNGLATVPAALGSLYQLRSLRLPDNCLTDLPDELSHLYRLSEFGLFGNNFTHPAANKIRAWFRPGVVSL